MANYEVDTWIQNVTSTEKVSSSNNSPTAGNTEDMKEEAPDLHQDATVEEIEGEGDASPPPLPPHSAIDVSGLQPLPFPTPKEYPRVNESVPTISSPSIYLQRRCPICFFGSKQNFNTSACVPVIVKLYAD